MNRPEVSIIVPVYNVEKYLSQCLNSLITQTLKEIEIICIDDGSTDGSLQILRSFEEKDSRIKVHSRANAGLGVTRNHGLAMARGDFVGFVDSDDWVDPHMFEYLYSKAKVHEADTAICRSHLHDDVTNQLIENPTNTKHIFFPEVDSTIEELLFHCSENPDYIFKMPVTVWNKIYRRSFLESSQISFPKVSIFEDNVFFFRTILASRKNFMTRRKLYYHRVNREGSLMGTRDKLLFTTIEIHDLIEKVIAEKMSSQIPYFLKYKFNNVGRCLAQVYTEYKNDFFADIKADYIKIDPEHLLKLNNRYQLIHNCVVTSNSYEEYMKKYTTLMQKVSRSD